MIGRRPGLWLGALVAGAVLTGSAVACASPSQDLARAVHSSPPQVQEAYAYAVAHPEVLRYIPCYCGCEAVSHTSNEDCFVDQQSRDGAVVYDSMGLG